MSYIQFESSRVKEAEREEVRDARAKILQKAEDDYHRKQAEKEMANLRGDDQWMLSSVEANISSEKKTKKKHKKEKKKKKSKKKKKHSRSSSNSGSSDSEEEQWVEKITIQSKECAAPGTSVALPQKPVERDEWMNLPGLFPCVTRDEIKKTKNKDNVEEENKGIMDKMGQSDKELNPHWRNGGTGLPQTESKSAGGGQIMDARWLKKSLQRAQEQADEQGKSLEEIAAERWGSLDKLKSMIADAESKSQHSYRSRNIQTKERSKGFMRPESDDNHCNQRQQERNRSKEGYRRDNSNSRERSKRRSRSRSYEKQDSHSRNRYKRSRSKEDDRSRSRSRERSYRTDKYRRDRDKHDFDFEKRKVAFKKPSDDDKSYTSSISKPSSSSTRNWKKPGSETVVARNLGEPQVKAESSGSSSESEPEKSEDKQEKVLTEAELNQLGAKIIKAEIMGDNELATALKAQLESARTARKNAPAKTATSKEENEDVILTRTDARGMTRPVEPKSQYEEPKEGRRKKKKKVDTHASGERVRYFADDDKYSLKEMFQHEKGRSTNDDDAMFTKLASKTADMDEMFEQEVCREESDAKQDERNRMHAIKEHQKMSKSLDNCRWCVDSKQMLKHMIAAMASKVYLSLPSHGSLTTGHCILSPIHHVTCQTQLDEDVWEELQTFRKALTKMFMDQNEDVVFFETSMGHHKFPHMQLECVPLPREVGDTAPIYFKKALLECETEWSNNIKVVDLSQKDVRRAIPKGLPYFSVDFGMQGGFAHVIEDEELFPKNFAQEIIGGMLDLDHSLWRKPRKENFDQQRRKVMAFAEIWKKYDFTANIDSD